MLTCRIVAAHETYVRLATQATTAALCRAAGCCVQSGDRRARVTLERVLVATQLLQLLAVGCQLCRHLEGRIIARLAGPPMVDVLLVSRSRLLLAILMLGAN